MEKHKQLGFPVPLLGMEPVRLPVLYDDGDLLALAKPVGVLVQSDAWYPKLPVLIEAIRHQSQQQKPEFARLGIDDEGLWAITDLDPDCYGPVLFARNRETAESLKSELGSGKFTFTFRFMSRSKVTEPVIDCSLPIARHRHQARILVSHTTGKKAATQFVFEEANGATNLWQAMTQFPRRHQIMLHSSESGLPVMGDTLYARENLLLLSQLKRNYQYKRDAEERPMYPGPAIYLSRIDLEGRMILCPEPPRWNGLRKQLGKYAR